MVNLALLALALAAGACRDAPGLDRLRKGLAVRDALRVDLDETVGFGANGRAPVPGPWTCVVHRHRRRLVLDHIARAIAARMVDLDHAPRVTETHGLQRLGRAAFAELPATLFEPV